MPILWLRLLEKAFSMLNSETLNVMPHTLIPNFRVLNGIGWELVFSCLVNSNKHTKTITHNIQIVVDSDASINSTFQKLMTRTPLSHEERDAVFMGIERHLRPDAYSVWNRWIGSLPQRFRSAGESKDTCINPIFKQYKNTSEGNTFLDFPHHSTQRCYYDPDYEGNVYRFEDFIKFLEIFGRTLDDNIKKSVIDWVSRSRYLPGKRYSGKYTEYECDLFDKIKKHLTIIKKGLICAGTSNKSNKVIDKKRGKNLRLNRNHAYSVVAIYEHPDRGIKYVQIVDPNWHIPPTFIDLHDLIKYFNTIIFVDLDWTPR